MTSNLPTGARAQKVVSLEDARAREFLAQVDALQRVAVDPVAFVETLNSELEHFAEERGAWQFEELALAPDIVEARALASGPRIVVLGVGGAGTNAVNNMIDAGLEGVEFVVANTDAQHLSFASASSQIQLGAQLTGGLGAGAHPEVGKSAAEESEDEIVAFIAGADMVFITAGMGGGTGTGAAPVIAKCARDRGILTVGVVTKPFTFEGRHRMRLADSGIAELQRYVDTLIVIPNQNLFRVANERTTFADAFGMADQVLHSGVRSITDLMILPGLINLDFADVRAVMSEMGKAMMGTGEASGDDRALMAAQNAIANPLLDSPSLKGAKAVLINITGGMDMTLLEVDEAANAIAGEVDADANIIFGAAFDPSLEGKIRVSVVATGMDEAVIKNAEPVLAPVDLHRPQPVRTPKPTIHLNGSELSPFKMIVDPWKEGYEANALRRHDGGEQQNDDQLAGDDDYEIIADDPIGHHRKSGWSLFGQAKRRGPPSTYAPPPARHQLRSTSQIQPLAEPEVQANEDLEIPSFLRRLAR